MNNQFSQRVSDIIVYSREEASRLQNQYIGPEHLLLGMLRDGSGKAIEILTKLDIDLKNIKKRLESFLQKENNNETFQDSEISLSPLAARILKMCILEARLLKSAIADSEHVLLAILKDGDNLAATVLEEYHIDGKHIVYEKYGYTEDNKVDYYYINYVPTGNEPVLGETEGYFLTESLEFIKTYEFNWWQNE